MFENVEYEWNLSDDNLTDMSDDEDLYKVSNSLQRYKSDKYSRQLMLGLSYGYTQLNSLAAPWVYKKKRLEVHMYPRVMQEQTIFRSEISVK